MESSQHTTTSRGQKLLAVGHSADDGSSNITRPASRELGNTSGSRAAGSRHICLNRELSGAGSTCTP
eukprot:6083318-Pyramimonas_sp.AAC.1